MRAPQTYNEVIIGCSGAQLEYVTTYDCFIGRAVRKYQLLDRAIHCLSFRNKIKLDGKRYYVHGA